MSGPAISVLYTTCNRAALLRRSLESLTAQTLPRDRFEVVVVDDGSRDDTHHIVGAFDGGLSLRFFRQPNSGISVGRNRALELSQGDIVLFMDDDDAAHPRLLEQHLRTHAKHSHDRFAVLGYTRLEPDIAQLPFMHFVTEVGHQLFAYGDLRHGEKLDYTFFWGGRSSCKRRFLDAHGVFDPMFRFGCEDIELGYRLSRHGLEVVYNANAISTMMRSISLRDYARRIYAQGRSNWHCARKHPVPEVRKWCGVLDLERRWSAMRPCLPLYQGVACEMEELYCARRHAGLVPDDALTWLLHRHYDLVLDGYRLKGSWDASQDTDAGAESGVT
jgi:glycosyltransferase involved in cell wall biosynthesis